MWQIVWRPNLFELLRTALARSLSSIKRKPTKRHVRGAYRAMWAGIVLAISLQPLASSAAWTQATGTSGTRFVSMWKVGTNIYAGALSGGLYVSTDDGATWSGSAFGGTFAGWTPYVVKQIGSVLYVGGTVGFTTAHLAYSTDSGATWTDLTSWGSARYIADIALINGATFVSAAGQGVYKSTANDGTGWALSNAGMALQTNVQKLAQVGSDIFVADASNNSYDGVYKSSNDGASWTRTATGLPASGGAGGQLINYNGTLFLTNGSGVYTSSNSGASWSLSLSASPQGLAINNATLYFSKAFSNALYTTTNDGSTWTSQDVSTISGGSAYLQPGIVISGGRLLLSSGDGIWREIDPAPSYSLTIATPTNGSVASDTGGISCRASCSAYFVSGASVQLTATANGGYTFSGWGGDCSGTANPLSVIMTANTACSATFAVANAAPTASAVSATGTAQVGVQLTGSYTYADAESDPEGTSIFRWVSNTVNTGIAGGTNVATTRNYTPVAGDQGGYLYFCVTPVASTGTTTGAEVCSAATAAVMTAAPTVTGISPTSGPTAGATAVTITGTNFTGATAVKFGSSDASSFTVNSATQITATAPSGTGTVDITVLTAGGTSATSANDQFTYVAAPTVTSVSPGSGPTAGGTSVTVTGTNFTGATAVSFGGTAATSFTVASASQITAASPAGTGAVDVRVTTTGGTSATSASDQFTYVAAPTVSSLSPTSGQTAGGTSVTITGTNFTGATAVRFGSTNATSYTVNSPTQITATSPAGSAGAVDITVVTAGGTSPTSAAGRFTYVAAPAVTSLAPGSGSNAGGTSVVISGTGFSGATTVQFGSANATSYVVNSATQITAIAPAGSVGTIDVTVTGPGGTSATGAGDQFTYVYQSYTGPTTGGGTATANISGGGANCHYSLAQFVAVSTVGTPPPAGLVFNHGLFDFALAGCTPGQPVTVAITYSSDPGSVYWKFGPTTADPTSHWYMMPNTAGASANIAGNVATLVITDGGSGDDDLSSNGTIIDAGGPASPLAGGAAGIPTLSEWAKLILAALLVVSFGFLRGRASHRGPLAFKQTRNTKEK